MIYLIIIVSSVIKHLYNHYFIYIESLFMAQISLKEGSVSTYQVLQNTITYQVRLSLTPKGLWMCI